MRWNVLGVVATTAFACANAFAQDCDGWWTIGDPSPRAFPNMTTDTGRGVVVMFGGSASNQGSTPYSQNTSTETWEFDGTKWKFRTLAGPSVRYRASMAYDAHRGVTVLFGGGLFHPAQNFPIGNSNETWEWDGITWTQRAIPGPSARSGSAMAYDAQRQQIVLYGGSAGPAEMWTYDGSAWTQVEQQGVWPGSRNNAVLGYDEAREVLVLVASGQPTMEWDGSAWTDANAVAPNSVYNTIAYDHTAQQLTFATANQAGNTFSRWDGTTWTPVANTPRVPNSQTFASLPGGNGILTFGLPSITAWFPANSTCYTLVEGVLAPLPQQTAPSRREHVALATDSNRERTVLFGGVTQTPGQFRDTWELRGQTWKLFSDGADLLGPTPTDFPGMVFDPIRNDLLLIRPGLWRRSNGGPWTRVNNLGYQGVEGTDYSPTHGALALVGGRLYKWNGTTLATWGSTGIQPGQSGFAFDDVRDRGISAGNNSSPFTYAFDPALTTWSAIITQIQTSNYDPELAYDPVRGGVILIGGFTGPLGGTGSLHNQTYFLASGATAWQRLSLRGPLGRKHHAMTYDPVSERVILFGGISFLGSPSEYLNDTWFLSSGPAAIVRQPVDTRAFTGTQAELFVIAKGGGPISFQWLRNGDPMSDTSGITGTDSDTLIFSDANPDDSDNYSCIVTNACGTQTSTAVTLTVKCPADFDDDGLSDNGGNTDGAVDINDLLYFLVGFEMGQVDVDVSSASGQWEPDDAVDINDLLYFLVRFEAGC